MSDGKCTTCDRHRSSLWECSHAECPHRKPGTSQWGPVPYERKHDGTGWDRFYKGQRRPPDKAGTQED